MVSGSAVRTIASLAFFFIRSYILAIDKFLGFPSIVAVHHVPSPVGRLRLHLQPHYDHFCSGGAQRIGHRRGHRVRIPCAHNRRVLPDQGTPRHRHVHHVEAVHGLRSPLGHGLLPKRRDPETANYIAIYIKLERHITDVKARIKLSLLDKDGEPVPSYSCPAGSGPGQVCTFTANKSSKGSAKFIDRAILETSDYLRDDCFRVRCDVAVFSEMRTEDRDATAGAIVVPSPDLGQHLGQLLSGGQGTDVTFEVAGETFPAHRYILAARSPEFMAELFGSMEEKTATCIRIEDMEARVFKALLHFIYTDPLPEIDEGDMMVMAQHLLVAADRYDMERMRIICEEKLSGYIDPSTVAIALALAVQHGCVGLKKECFQFLMSRSNLKAAMGTDGYTHLTSSCPSVISELLAKLAP